MKLFKLDDMKLGWFIGNITPTALTTKDCEVAIKSYPKGDVGKPHYHKIATEITVIISGKVKMNETLYSKGDIIVIEPYEVANFECIEDVVTCVVKIPGANNDKYEV